jgi:hypothetical protein
MQNAASKFRNLVHTGSSQGRKTLSLAPQDNDYITDDSSNSFYESSGSLRLQQESTLASQDHSDNITDDPCSGMCYVSSGTLLLKQETTLFGFCNNHVLVNRERVRFFLPPLRRSPVLDDLARKQAAVLAEKQLLEPSKKTVLEVHLAAKTVGENILCGSNVESMHQRIMHELPSHKRRILSLRYNEMGMGTAKSSDGKLYMVQYFRYNSEL